MMKAVLCLLFLCSSLSLNATIESVLTKIKQRSEAAQSDSLVILRHGKPLILHQPEECAGIDSMEMTKPFIGLAVALLLDEGRIPCLDLPVHNYYPLWAELPFREITLKQLLANTSGLDTDYSNPCCKPVVTAILDSFLQFYPGERFYQNQKALKLVLEIIRCVSGQAFNDYLYKRLFEPLGIQNISWRNGGAIDSLPQFQLSAWDLAKIGSLIAHGGEHLGKRIISQRWLDALFTPSQGFNPFFGLQWWLEFYDIGAWWDEDLLKTYVDAGISSNLICHLSLLQGRVVHFSGQVYGNHIVKLRGSDLIAHFDEGQLMVQLIKETHCKGVPLARFKTGKLKMASAHGRGGQHLIIMPQQGLVAVRQKCCMPRDGMVCDNFDDLPDLLENIAIECDCFID